MEYSCDAKSLSNLYKVFHNYFNQSNKEVMPMLCSKESLTYLSYWLLNLQTFFLLKEFNKKEDGEEITPKPQGEDAKKSKKRGIVKKASHSSSKMRSRKSRVTKKQLRDESGQKAEEEKTVLFQDPKSERGSEEGEECADADEVINFNNIQVTKEARKQLSLIKNEIGDYVCQLCKEAFQDAFLLASHNCCRIEHLEYKCITCCKNFNSPANLASHKRWHKPMANTANEFDNAKFKLSTLKSAKAEEGEC